MARSGKKYLKISKGQISSRLIERTDIGILDDSGQEITNFYNTKYGALQTVPSTAFRYNFGKDAKVKLFSLKITDTLYGFIAADATNNKLYLFSNEYLLLDSIEFPYITLKNYEKTNLVQHENLILMCTKDNPLIRIRIKNKHLSYEIYSIHSKNILKTKSTIDIASAADIYRTKEIINSETEANAKIPSLDDDWPAGTMVVANQTTDEPDTNFPWTVYVKEKTGDIVNWKESTFSPLPVAAFYSNTPGEYSYICPTDVSLDIKISGAGGGSFSGTVATNPTTCNGGSGELYETTTLVSAGTIISGIIGEHGKIVTDKNANNGGSGYSSGQPGAYTEEFGVIWSKSGGGGGSTSLKINENLIYEASGGGGGNYLNTGGKGGGPKGGNGGQDANGPKGSNGAVWIKDGSNIPPENGYVSISTSTSTSTSTSASNLWNNENYIYVGQNWNKQESVADIARPEQQFNISAVSGSIEITAPNSGTLFSVTSPTPSINVKNYAESTIIGTDFDSGENIGIVRINGIQGVASGNTFNVTKLTGITIIPFDKIYNPGTGFTIKTSSIDAFSGDFPLTTNNPTALANYPLNILFYQQRLIILGTVYNGEQIIVSKIDQYDNFKDEYLSNSAFQLIIGSDEKETIQAFCLNQGIQIFTDVSEWLINSQTITRTTGFIRNSQMGTNGIKPIISANGTTLFCPRNGKGIIGFTYNEVSASYMTPYISLFTNLLDSEVKDMLLKRGLDSQDDTLLFVCTYSGDLVIGNYLQDHNIQAFCLRNSTFTKFLQTIQSSDKITILSNRNGYTIIESVQNTGFTACSTTYSYDAKTGIISGIPEVYNNSTLNVYSKNEYIGQYVVIDGKIDVSDKKPESISEVGFNIHQVFESNPMNLGAETMAYYKAISNIKLALTPESRHEYIKINKKYGRRKGDMVSFVRPQKPMRDCRFTIENDIYPIEILSIEVELEY